MAKSRSRFSKGSCDQGPSHEPQQTNANSVLREKALHRQSSTLHCTRSSSSTKRCPRSAFTAKSSSRQSPASPSIAASAASILNSSASCPPLDAPLQRRDTQVTTPAVEDGRAPEGPEEGATLGPVIQRRHGPKSSSSEFLGVTQYKRTGKWEAHIWVKNGVGRKGKQMHLGTFLQPSEAAKCYDRACIHFRGKDAVLNFDRQQYTDDPFLMEHDKESNDQFVSALRAHASDTVNRYLSKHMDNPEQIPLDTVSGRHEACTGSDKPSPCVRRNEPRKGSRVKRWVEASDSEGETWDSGVIEQVSKQSKQRRAASLRSASLARGTQGHRGEESLQEHEVHGLAQGSRRGSLSDATEMDSQTQQSPKCSGKRQRSGKVGVGQRTKARSAANTGSAQTEHSQGAVEDLSKHMSIKDDLLGSTGATVKEGDFVKEVPESVALKAGGRAASMSRALSLRSAASNGSCGIIPGTVAKMLDAAMHEAANGDATEAAGPGAGAGADVVERGQTDSGHTAGDEGATVPHAATVHLTDLTTLPGQENSHERPLQGDVTINVAAEGCAQRNATASVAEQGALCYADASCADNAGYKQSGAECGNMERITLEQQCMQGCAQGLKAEPVDLTMDEMPLNLGVAESAAGSAMLPAAPSAMAEVWQTNALSTQEPAALDSFQHYGNGTPHLAEQLPGMQALALQLTPVSPALPTTLTSSPFQAGYGVSARAGTCSPCSTMPAHSTQHMTALPPHGYGPSAPSAPTQPCGGKWTPVHLQRSPAHRHTPKATPQNGTRGTPYLAPGKGPTKAPPSANRKGRRPSLRPDSAGTKPARSLLELEREAEARALQILHTQLPMPDLAPLDTLATMPCTSLGIHQPNAAALGTMTPLGGSQLTGHLAIGSLPGTGIPDCTPSWLDMPCPLGPGFVPTAATSALAGTTHSWHKPSNSVCSSASDVLRSQPWRPGDKPAAVPGAAVPAVSAAPTQDMFDLSYPQGMVFQITEPSNKAARWPSPNPLRAKKHNCSANVSAAGLNTEVSKSEWQKPLPVDGAAMSNLGVGQGAHVDTVNVQREDQHADVKAATQIAAVPNTNESHAMATPTNALKPGQQRTQAEPLCSQTSLGQLHMDWGSLNMDWFVSPDKLQMPFGGGAGLSTPSGLNTCTWSSPANMANHASNSPFGGTAGGPLGSHAGAASDSPSTFLANALSGSMSIPFANSQDPLMQLLGCKSNDLQGLNHGQHLSTAQEVQVGPKSSGA